MKKGGTWVHRLSNIDTINRTALCANCGPVRIYIRRRIKGIPLWICKIAKKKHQGIQKNTEHRKEYDRLRKRLRKRCKRPTGPECEICRSNIRLCWDHNHETGEHRGTLCRLCNAGLGMFRDKISLLTKAIEYLGR